MGYTILIFCDEHGPHTLHIDDAVIQNWAAAMWEDGCKPMVMAVPQMMAAITEWRANWLGSITFHQLHDAFQDIPDFWAAKHAGQPQPDTAPPRLPGDWLEQYPVNRPTPQI